MTAMAALALAIVVAACREFEPKAARPTPGALDLCFLAEGPLDAVVRRLEAAGIPIEAGPVLRTGATGPIWSVRDPDGNLIEIAEPVRTTAVASQDLASDPMICWSAGYSRPAGRTST